MKVAVETRAMDLAIDYWSQMGTVDDVHGNESYDLRCDVDGVEVHIEVKGTTTEGERVLLTPNEVRHARDHAHTCLFIVSGIAVERSGDSIVEASGGAIRILNPWSPDQAHLDPIGYFYDVPTKS